MKPFTQSIIIIIIIIIIKTCNVVLTFEYVDEILWCDHSNETSSAVLLHGTAASFFFNISQNEIWEFLKF